MSLFHITSFPALLTLTHTYSFRVLIVASTVRVVFLGVTQTAPFSWTSFSTRGRQRRICLFKTDFLWLTYFVASVHAERNPRKYGEVRGLRKKKSVFTSVSWSFLSLPRFSPGIQRILFGLWQNYSKFSILRPQNILVRLIFDSLLFVYFRLVSHNLRMKTCL